MRQQQFHRVVERRVHHRASEPLLVTCLNLQQPNLILCDSRPDIRFRLTKLLHRREQRSYAIVDLLFTDKELQNNCKRSDKRCQITSDW